MGPALDPGLALVPGQGQGPGSKATAATKVLAAPPKAGSVAASQWVGLFKDMSSALAKASMAEGPGEAFGAPPVGAAGASASAASGHSAATGEGGSA